MQVTQSTTAASRFTPDVSAQRELRSLEKLPVRVSGERMAQAILKGIHDKDGQGAAREQQTIAAWARGHEGKLTPEAKQVLEVYADHARAARAKGRGGFLPEEVKSLKAALLKAGEPRLRDTSMRQALEQLDRKSGQISGRELCQAVLTGMDDKDGRGASIEYGDVARWARNNEARLSPEAREVLRTYGRYATAARDAGEGGFTRPVAERLERDLRKAAGPAAGPNEPKPTGKVDTRAEADKFFLTQWGPNKWNKTSASKYGFADCAPTSCVMALSALGLLPRPSADNASRMIDNMRDRTRGHNTNYSDGTTVKEVLRGLNSVKGASARQVSATLDNLDRALAGGKTAVLGGVPWDSWGRNLRREGDYLNSKNPGGHSVAVLGKTAKGTYLLADPLSLTGTVEVSRKQLREFWKDFSGNGSLVVVGRD
jgi:hypothetical protein